jgi:hypothetical protein
VECRGRGAVAVAVWGFWKRFFFLDFSFLEENLKLNPNILFNS